MSEELGRHMVFFANSPAPRFLIASAKLQPLRYARDRVSSALDADLQKQKGKVLLDYYRRK